LDLGELDKIRIKPTSVLVNDRDHPRKAVHFSFDYFAIERGIGHYGRETTNKRDWCGQGRCSSLERTKVAYQVG